jgi:hypothetical protein
MTKSLTPREANILVTLEDGPASMETLRRQLINVFPFQHTPATTVRRIIGDLRRKGYVISATLPNSRNNRYALSTGTTQQTEGALDGATV